MAEALEHVVGRARLRCLLFDLDGTLADSREDLVTSVNLTLAPYPATCPSSKIVFL
jgi:hypothetical protein